MKEGSSQRARRAIAGCAACLVALASIAAGACFPSLGDLTSGGADGGPRAGEGGSEGGREGGGDVGSITGMDGSPEDSSGGDTSQNGGCEAQFSSDPANCGSNVHSCLGGTCVNCLCQPITLATTSGSVGIAIDQTYVYWANTEAPNSGIYKISKALTQSGTPSPVEVGASYANVQGLASDGEYVYWTNKSDSGSVQRALPTGTAGSLTTLVTGQNQPDWIAVAMGGADVFWTNQGTNQVMSTPVVSIGGTAKQLNTVGEVGTLPADLAIDSTNVYYATKTSGGGEAESVPLAGGMVSEVGAATYVGITVDDDNVYWTGGFASPTVSQNLKGMGPDGVQIIASGGSLTCPLHLVSDGANVYFFDQGTTTQSTTTEAGTLPPGTVVPGAGALYRVPVGNSAGLPPPIVTGLTDPQAIAEDGMALYWVTGGPSGAVMKLAK